MVNPACAEGQPQENAWLPDGYCRTAGYGLASPQDGWHYDRIAA